MKTTGAPHPRSNRLLDDALGLGPMKDHKEFLPSPEQELLLKAALCPAADAIRHWQAWRSQVNLARIDAGTMRLLPLLYQNLRGQGVDDPMLNQLKPFYRSSWFMNKLLLRAAVEPIAALKEAGIPTLVLKGAALIAQYSTEAEARPMGDVDVFVPTRHARKGIEIIGGCGWRPKGPLPNNSLFQAYLAVKHGHGFQNASGQIIDFHWHVMDECIDRSVDEDFLMHAVPVKIEGMETMALNPADQILHVCVHGARWSPDPSLRWAADVMTILNRKDTFIDWDRLCRNAGELRLTLPLREALGYLKRRLDAPIPADVLKDFRRVPVETGDRYHYWIITGSPARLGPLWRIKRQSARYLRVVSGAGRPRRIYLFFEFLVLGLYEFSRGVLWPRLKGIKDPIP